MSLEGFVMVNLVNFCVETCHYTKSNWEEEDQYFPKLNLGNDYNSFKENHNFNVKILHNDC